MSKQKQFISGFTLVDMSIMLAVVAAAGVMLLSGASVKKEDQDLGSSLTQMSEIKAAIEDYFTKNGALPCPASRSQLPDTASFGRATDCSAAAPTGTIDPAVPTGYASSDAIRTGVVPTRTLNLPDEYMFDEWGNRISYSVVKELAKTSVEYAAFTTAVTTGVLQVVDAAGTQLTSASVDNVVGYVLVSHGKDGRGSFARKGAANKACGATELDGENCDNDYVFRYKLIDDSQQGAAFFYDLVEYQMAPESAVVPATPTVTLTAELKGLAVGGLSSCAIKSDNNAMYCWGYDVYGQIGDGSPSGKRYAPAAVSGGKTWKRLGMGGSSDGNVCAIATDDTGWCWGLNSYGAVGDGSTTTRNVPTAVSGGYTWADIDAGEGHSCGVTTNGLAYCWGYNSKGQLGDGTITNRTIPTLVSGGYTWKSIAVGSDGYATCGIQIDDTLWCWGANSVGQLGIGNTTEQHIPTQVGTATWKLVDTSGYNATCGIQSDDSLWCWGEGYHNMNGVGATQVDKTSPYKIDATNSYKFVSAGAQNSCAIRLDDTLWCWGEALDVTATNSMYGNGSTTQLYAMVSPSGSYTTWTDVGIADSHICAIEKTTSGAFCWGSNFYAGMGVVSTTSGSNTPCAINSTYTWGPNAAATSTTNSGCPIALSVTDFPIDNGGITTCGVTAMGKAYCWGDGSQRQIGNGTSTNINTAIQLVSGGYTWKMVDSGGDTNCGVTTAGVGYCWGRGDKGEVGNGTSGAYNYKSTPVLVSGGHTWKKIGLNSDSIDTTYGAPVCGITMAGALYCWGDNTNGKLGDGTTTQRTTPVAVSGGGTWADVAPGTDHTCGLKTDGSVWCWGLNTSGQLGNGTTTSSSVPVRESSNSSWKQVWAGYDATCGVKSDDTAWCWGNGTNSKLGNGTSTNKTSPTIVSGGHTWTMVSVGRYAMCGVRKTDSLIMCAGVATWGQLGRGTTAGTQSTPVVISDTNTYTSVSVGYYEDVCATRTDKTGWCWGGNGMGEGARGNQTRATVATAMQGCTLWGYDAAAMTETSSAPGCGAAVVPMKSLTAGGANSCGVTASGNGYCWGYNGDGQLGISGDTTDKLVPTAVTGGAVWSGIDAGDSMTCGIKTADQSAWCWGVGALGDGAGWQAGTSVAKQVSGGATWSKVVGGTEVACGIKSDGTLWCWGNRFGGLLGTGSTSGYNTVPTQVTGGGTWIDVAMGTCGIKTDGTLWCWGGVNGATTPTLFDSGSWIKIASGEVHTCGIKTGGAAYCWGDGYHGTLGDGNLAAHTASTPVAVLGGNTFTDISLFQYGTCGLTSTGTIKCWGIGAYGERGYGGTSQTATPTAISGTDTFTAVDAGWRHVCGLKTDKTAMCWGASGDGTTGYGAIGDGALVNRLTPVTVSGGNVFK